MPAASFRACDCAYVGQEDLDAGWAMLRGVAHSPTSLDPDHDDEDW